MTMPPNPDKTTQTWGQYLWSAAKNAIPATITGYAIGSAPGALVGGGVQLAMFFTEKCIKFVQ